MARSRRGERVLDRSLARGPACLTQALGIGKEHDGMDLCGRLELPATVAEDVSVGPRVGVSVAHDVPWRFWLTGDRTVSAYKRSPRAPQD
jgi:DNA-3-methyladenine glycosylase